MRMRAGALDVLEAKVLEAVVALPRVGMLPPGNVLLVGDSDWSEPLWDGLVVDRVHDDNRLGGKLLYDRVVLTPLGDAEWPRVLEACWNVLRPDGLLIVAAPRVWPWGVVGTPWHGGLPVARWRRYLRETGWRVVGFSLVGGGFLGAFGYVLLAEKVVRGGARAPVTRVPAVMKPKPALGRV